MAELLASSLQNMRRRLPAHPFVRRDPLLPAEPRPGGRIWVETGDDSRGKTSNQLVIFTIILHRK
jgi:hypothetical protein